MAENRELKKALENGSLSDQFGWRIFRIMAEFVDGFELIQSLKNTVSFFGSVESAMRSDVQIRRCLTERILSLPKLSDQKKFEIFEVTYASKS